MRKGDFFFFGIEVFFLVLVSLWALMGGAVTCIDLVLSQRGWQGFDKN